MSSEDDLEIRPGTTIPGWELWFTASRSGGPGGQHANKASTRVTLHWSIATTTALSEEERQRVMGRLSGYINEEGVLQISASDTRSQHQNLKLARQRLAEEVERAMRKKKRRVRTRPTKASQRRRVQSKRRRGQIKDLRKPPTGDDH